MKKEILKIAGVKSEKEFYKKYPTEEAFMKAHKKEFKKAAMGAAMVQKQLTQLTDYANPPQAQVGWHSEWEQDPYTGTSDSEAAYLAEIDARNVAQNPMKIPSVKVSKSSTEAKKPASNNYSVVDFMNSKGLKSDFNTRKGLAQQYGIKDYKGTAEQNLQLLSHLKGKAPAAPKKTEPVKKTEPAKKEETPAPKKAAPTKPKLSKAEEYIAKDPYFFAEESDPEWIKTIDAPFAGLRNLGARVVMDRDPKALAELVAMGALSGLGKMLLSKTEEIYPYNPRQIGAPPPKQISNYAPTPKLIGGRPTPTGWSTESGLRSGQYPIRKHGGYVPQAAVGDYIGGEQSSYKPMNYTELYDQADYANTGMNRKMRMEQSALEAQQQIAENTKKKGGIFDMLGQLAPQLDALNISTPGTSPFVTAPDMDMNAQFAAEGFRHGGHIPKAQGGFIQGLTDFSNKAGKSIGQGYDKLDKGLGKIGGIPGAINIGGEIAQGFQAIKKARDERRQAKQSFELSGLTKQVAGLAPDIAQRKYVRPEDMAFGTQEMGQTYGAGTNFLAANGIMISGNPTEIQNMYNPGDIYSDLGYEPLSDSDVVKQYRRGGIVPRAQFGQAGNAFGSLIGGNKGRPTAGGQLGGTIGKTVGSFIPIPGAKQALEFVGSTVGSIFGAKRAKETARYQEGAQQNTQDAAFMSGARGMQAQNAAYMEDGGWISHNWQPQVITTFGEYKLKDLLKPDETMDTLRAGGHLKSYTPPSAAAMSTERPDMAMGGNLKTTWGGYAEPISENPYLPGSGETVIFRGQSHDESDGNGNTGIGVKYGKGVHDSYTDYAEYGTEQADADVEVERDEPATELLDAETGDTSLIVYGNMPIPSYGAAELGDPKVKGKKFKAYAKDLSKQEAKQNKIVEKGTKLIDSVDSDSPFDLLKLNSGQAMVMGANDKLKGLAIQKQRLAGIQNAILDTAEEMGMESDALAKGQIKPIKDSDMAKFGGKFTKAQSGVVAKPDEPDFVQQIYQNPNVVDAFMNRWPNLLESVQNRTQPVTMTKKDLGKKDIPSVKAPSIKISKEDVPTLEELQKINPEQEKDRFTIEDALMQLQPYLIPSNQEPFDYQQITPEMMALAQNQLEPVQAQTFQPLLEQPFSVSLQDQLNANQADFNALQRQLGYNPAALSQLAAQKYAANSAVLAQQARINQEMQMGAYNRNRGVLNDAALKNMAILDQQYQRQSQARSNTKAQAQAALTSIADKIAKNKLENRTLGIYENMYNYRFGPKGRAINVNAPNKFSTDMMNMTADELQAAADKRREEEKKSSKKGSSRNGSIVKAIKNL